MKSLGMKSMGFKMFIICFLFVSGSVAFISELSVRFVRNEIGSNNHFYINQMLLNMEQHLILTSSSLHTILYSLQSAGLADQNEEQARPVLQQLYEMNRNLITNVYRIQPDLSIVGGSPLSRVFNEALPERQAIVEAARSSPGVVLIGPYASTYSGWTVTLAKHSPSRGGQGTVFALDMDLRAIEDSLLRMNREDALNIVILDSYGRAIAVTPGFHLLGMSDDFTFTIGGMTSQHIAASKENTILATDGGQDTFTIIKKNASRFQWSIVSINNETALKKSINKINLYYYILIAIGLVISLIVAAVMSKYIRKPLQQLVQRMTLVKNGIFNKTPTSPRSDEFGLLSQHFDTMVEQIAELIYRNEQNMEKQRVLEIQVLQAQINPHFLYNTLGSISNAVNLGQYHQVDPVIAALIRIMEYGIEDASKKVTLRDELQNIDYYLQIQRVRYNQDFQLLVLVEDELLDVPLFRMLLQPIVENSLFHGYQGGRIAGDITIHAYRKEQDLLIEVRDSGAGMTEERRSSLLTGNSEAASTARKRIGLMNIHQRIQLYYGEGYRLQIESEPKLGTCVRIVMPYAPYREDG